MRIVSGSAKGQEIKAPAGRSTRPLTDTAREALFNILGDVSGLSILDCYAGSGAVGLEALSRGAQRAVGVEKAQKAASVIKYNAQRLGFSQRYKLFTQPVEQWLRQHSEQFDLIFFGPPFKLLDEAVLAKAAEFLKPGALLIVHSDSLQPTAQAGELALVEDRTYGESRLSFYRA
jgi:16S rRNA (guanine966-N2)-methyltransferase